MERRDRLIGVLGADATVWGPWTVAVTTRDLRLLCDIGNSHNTENFVLRPKWALGRGKSSWSDGTSTEARSGVAASAAGGSHTVRNACGRKHLRHRAAVWHKANMPMALRDVRGYQKYQVR